MIGWRLRGCIWTWFRPNSFVRCAGLCTKLLGLHQKISHFHQGKAQQIQPSPILWLDSIRIVFAHTDSPDVVAGTGFYDDATACCEQILLQGRMLGEFMHIALNHDLRSVLLPLPLIKIADLPTELLGFPGRVARQDLCQYFLISKQSRFASHHPMFCCQIGLIIYLEWMPFPPLTETCVSDTAIIRRPMTPEKQVFGTAALLNVTLEPVYMILHVEKYPKKEIWVFECALLCLDLIGKDKHSYE